MFQMNDYASLRIYFQNKTRVERKGFWSRLMAPSLGTHLISAAKKDGIEQAVYQPIIAGYLKGDPVSCDISEAPPPKLPSCVELIDSESKLRNFLKDHEDELRGIKAVLVRAESILPENTENDRAKMV
jgi:PII-like signaling protein